MQKKIPAILSDINGVLLRDKKPISKQISSAVKQLRAYRYEDKIKYQLPFVCITNEFQTTEMKYAQYLNEQFDLRDDYKFDERHIALSYSPLRRYKSFFINKKILFIGDQSRADFELIAQQLQIFDFITQNEYLSTIQKHGVDQEEKEKFLNQTIEVIILFSTPQNWERTLGIFDNIRQYKGYKQKLMFKTPSFIAMHNDSIDISPQLLNIPPRMNMGSFNEIFKKMHSKLYHFDAQIDMMGKPERESFEYSGNMLRRLALQFRNVQDSQKNIISNYYMIGDDPYSDIFGANNYGWKSILVRTGVFQGQDNDKIFPSKHVVNDFYEALSLIEQLEGIKLIQ